MANKYWVIENTGKDFFTHQDRDDMPVFQGHPGDVWIHLIMLKQQLGQVNILMFLKPKLKHKRLWMVRLKKHKKDGIQKKNQKIQQ